MAERAREGVMRAAKALGPPHFWRYTHRALTFLFQTYGGLETLRCGYDAGPRWRNRGTERFREHWSVVHIGRKPA